MTLLVMQPEEPALRLLRGVSCDGVPLLLNVHQVQPLGLSLAGLTVKKKKQKVGRFGRHTGTLFRRHYCCSRHHLRYRSYNSRGKPEPQVSDARDEMVGQCYSENHLKLIPKKLKSHMT